MDTYQIEILEPGAKRLLEDMADMQLITVQQIDVEGTVNDEEGTHHGKGGAARDAIMSLAGSWDGMSESDFDEYLIEAKRSGGEMFDRDVRL